MLGVRDAADVAAAWAVLLTVLNKVLLEFADTVVFQFWRRGGL